ncbi:hypothetical protein Q1695_008949 [Nippostrongylus brasiliensis]|nr:hypothetical protein Q1695_008949 [Nippostrongylus brasiliensis]
MSDDEFEEKKPIAKKAPERKEKYGALVMVIDCGNTMSETEEGRSHFSMAKEAADWILSRKIFTLSKDRVNIILFGCEDTKNDNDVSGVYVQDEVLSKINFDHLRFLNRETAVNPNRTGNAIDALVVAADFLYQQTNGDANVLSKNILLFTNGLADCGGRGEEIQAAINGINAMQATLVTIGIDEDPSTSSASKNVLMDIVTRTDGMNYGFNRAIRKNWEIAPGVRLPLALYTKSVAAKNPLKSVYINEDGEQMHRQSRFLVNVKTNDTTTDSSASELKDITEKEKRIQVYYFGDTKVPIGEDDEARYHRHNFNEGEVRGCMKLIQFTKKENLKQCYLIGRNSFVAVPGWEKKTSERDLKCMRVTQALGTAMLENDVMAICRYAPDAAKHLQLMALIPHRDEELDFILSPQRLPFAEDMRPFNFVNVAASCPKPNHNQVNLIDELIEEMQFSTENGSLEPESVLNPFFQRQCTAMKLRALNDLNSGDESKISDLIAPSTFLKRGLEPDSKLLKRAEHVLNTIAADGTGFSLHEVVKVKRVKQEIRREDISEWLAELESSKEDMKPDVNIKEKRPQNRFVDRARARLSDNFEFHMSSLLEEVVVMVSAEDEEAEQLHQIAYGRLVTLRSLAIEFGRPTEFNEWLMLSKTQWPEWARFCASKDSGGLSLISTDECSSSEYSNIEAAGIWAGCD